VSQVIFSKSYKTINAVRNEAKSYYINQATIQNITNRSIFQGELLFYLDGNFIVSLFAIIAFPSHIQDDYA